jgi:hypothetical protein
MQYNFILLKIIIDFFLIKKSFIRHNTVSLSIIAQI